MDIGKGVIVHALAEIDGIEYLHLIFSDGLKRIAAFHQTGFGIVYREDNASKISNLKR